MSYNGNAKSNASRSRSHSSRSSSSSAHSNRSSGSTGHSKSTSSASSGGFGGHSSGGLGMGGGSFHGGLGGKASYGGGMTAHESFSKSVGHSYSGGGRDRHDQQQHEKQQRQQAKVSQAIASHTFSEVATHSDYGLTKDTSGVGGLTGKGTLADMWQGTKQMFSDTVTPTGAFEGYGFQQASYEDTPFSQRSYSEQWQKDKLGTISNLASNPLVSAGMWATGLGAVNVGAQLASTVRDMAEGDLDMTKGLGKLASKAITTTPLGKGLGQFAGVAGAALGSIGDTAQMGEAIAGFAGSKVGGMLGAGLGALTGNPYVGAATTVAGAVLGGKAAQSAVEDATHGGVGGAMQAAAMTSQRTARTGGDGQADRMRSRPVQQQPLQQPQTPAGQLQASGQQAVQSAQQLQSIDPNVLKYIPQGGYIPFAQGVTGYNPYR